MSSSSTLKAALAHVPKRKIGDTSVFPIGYGLMGLSAFYGAIPTDEERLELLDSVYESGCTYWDSADVYGDSEDLLGKWFKRTGKRSSIFLATKFGYRPHHVVDGSPEYMRQAVASSLSRLGTTYIDLYYLHRPDPNTPIEVTVGAMSQLVEKGIVRNIGLSECSAETIRRAHAVHPIAAVEVEYSPFTLDIEDESINILNTCRELGITVVAYAPLGRGLLSGRITSPDQLDENDFRRTVPKFSKENFPKILSLVNGLRDIGEKHNATPSQIALAWLLEQGDDIIPIPGTRRVTTLEENLRSVLIELSPEELKEVRRAASEADLAGISRYPPDMQGHLYADTPKPTN